MSTITKEWLLKTIAELEEERDSVPGAVNEDAANALAAMKLALASLEAEPVFEVEVSGNHWLNAGPVDDSDFSGMPDGVNQLYSAPPAPVSVPLAIHDEDFEKALSVLNDTLDDCGDSERGLLLALDKVGIEVRSDARHAAMLQGADGTLTNEDTKRVGELVMWVKRLAYSLRKANPDSKLQSDAMDYLSRMGLIGVEDILR